MHLKSLTLIVRQIWEPKAKKIKGVWGRNGGSVVWNAMTFFGFISILERAPVTFDRCQK
ncbi:hypothetical protein SAMN02745781_03208 [Vibrio gazogenes DSM 21264]|uniref:Uncharacterized protein n=1 Tax=Vibrio gazogenes DSM 21264 = NBRC 103151 TaxID=1123492 RepID=A0A1M5EMQ1_VIBGA|nr:hypothetical protein SAMN02745781_03208 [Vibrio gazogenes DSM 21264] [Vibrio gazogenes DSM 21264 = NBRC 103151]